MASSTVARSSSSAFGTRTCHTRPSTLRLPARPQRGTVVVRADISRLTPPAGVTLPAQEPMVPPPSFGFVSWAEKINGRACMMGFFALLAIEAVTGRGFLEMLGFSIGNGLGFEL